MQPEERICHWESSKYVVAHEFMVIKIHFWSDNFYVFIFIVYYRYVSVSQPLDRQIIQLKFHPLEVVSRWRDPQLQVSEKISDFTKLRLTIFKFLLIYDTLYL